MWFFLALSSAVFYSFRGILEKRIISGVNNYILGFAIRLFAMPFFFLPFLWNSHSFVPLQQLNGQFWFAILMICLVSTPIETILYYKALETEEVTLVLPVLALGPVLTVLFGTLALREIPSVMGIMGVLMLVLGIYALKIGHAKDGIFQPIHHLKNNPAIRLMLLVMISQSFSAIWDKMGVSNSNAYMYALINYICVSFTLWAIAVYKARDSFHQLYTHGKSFFLIGAVIAAYTLLYYVALQTGLAGYVSAIKSSYILFTMVLGILFLKEKDAKQKILSGGFIVLGLVLIKLFS